MAKKHRQAGHSSGDGKLNGNGSLINKFGRHAVPWAGLPKRQMLPPDIDVNQYIADLDYAFTTNPHDAKRLTRPTFIKIATAFCEDAAKVRPVMNLLFPFIRNFAENDILRARGDAIIHSNGDYKNGSARHRAAFESPKISFCHADIKTVPRIIKKALDECGGDFDKITDVERVAYEANSRDEITALCVVLEWLCQSQYPLPPGNARIVHIDNRFETATGTRYRSFKAIVAIPIPDDEERYHLAEIMVRHSGFEKDILVNRKNKLNKDSHSLYETMRFMEERYQLEEWPYEAARTYQHHWNIIADIHDGAARKNDILKPLDFKTFRTIRISALQAAATQNPMYGPQLRDAHHD